MAGDQLFSLCWKDAACKQNKIFNDLWQKGEQVDVSIICGLQTFHAHRIVLSASSTYFRQALKDISFNGSAVILLPTIDAEIFAGLLQFIYTGEASVEERLLKCFIETANTLKIGGIHNDSRSIGRTEESPAKPNMNPLAIVEPAEDWESNDNSTYLNESHIPTSPANIKCEVIEDDMLVESGEESHVYKCDSEPTSYSTPECQPTESNSSYENVIRPMAVPVASSTKVRRMNLSIAEKVEIIYLLELHTPRIDIIKKFGCSNSLLTKISSDKDNILHEWAETGNPNRKRKKRLKFPEMENELREWFCQAKNTGIQVSDTLLEEKAKEIAGKLNNTEFVFTHAWLSRWKKRNYKTYWKAENHQRISVLKALTNSL